MGRHALHHHVAVEVVVRDPVGVGVAQRGPHQLPRGVRHRGHLLDVVVAAVCVGVGLGLRLGLGLSRRRNRLLYSDFRDAIGICSK